MTTAAGRDPRGRSILENPEALLLEDRLRLGARQKGEEPGWSTALCHRCECKWIDDRLVSAGRKGRDDFHLRIGVSVRLIDDPQRRLVSGDETQRRPNIVGLRQLRLGDAP